ncbi:glucose-1-phosphate thymidylyltransferase RfbA [Fluviispira sanaruensis]|uniref:Glucose-1-phosphate thymidylyltransferase n=1 Tax=Fluviispira sanaruensis TaxID=2493639 RepID=A0A4P2VLM9_FLUSA|nr:glucose-1-phosphate thymidylyltransferase RfbA [Fluviispira sanaruensis]BBH53781.1 glucose-1-phosphate thymidylyltransferase RfbA [Fluviispira sanaruensis]
MKGIILAGGTGSRLYPATSSLSKQLMPIYDKPMIYYPLSTLMLADIKDILIISTPRDLPAFKNLLGDGKQWGISLSYAEQPSPDGLAQAFIIGEEFIGEDNVCLILGDNIFHGNGLGSILSEVKNNLNGATVFGYSVNDPERYGVVEYDENFKVISIEEKPKIPKSNCAVTGLYFFDKRVSSYAKQLKPSARAELEITDLMNVYLANEELKLEILHRGFAWLDTGTHRSLLEASLYVSVLEERQGLKVSCPEEIAWRKGFISTEEFEKQAMTLVKSGYGKYLLKLIGINV